MVLRSSLVSSSVEVLRFFSTCADQGCFWHRFSSRVVCELLQGEVGDIFELSDQKARGFLVQISFKRLVLEHARKVFGEMTMRA
jgi:hypothetical protein